MTEEIKALLISKFLELGGKLPLLRCNKSSYESSVNDTLHTIINSKTIQAELEKIFGTKMQYRKWIDSSHLEGTHFGVATINVDFRNSIKSTHTYTKGGRRIFKVESEYSIDLDTTHLVGDTKKKMEDKIIEAKASGDYTSRTYEEKKGEYDDHIRQTIRRFGKYVTKNNSKYLCVTEYAYILYYKELFVFLTKEECNQLLIDREASANSGTFEELKTLTVEKLQEKESGVGDIKGWLKKELTELEQRLEQKLNDNVYKKYKKKNK